MNVVAWLSWTVRAWYAGTHLLAAALAAIGSPARAALMLFLLSIPIGVLGQPVGNATSIDRYLKEVIASNQIPGMAVGISKNNKVVFQNYYGIGVLEDSAKVDSSSLFRIYSTTKLISTVGAFQLIERGQLSLEDKLSTYIENLPLTWQDVKIKNILSHSSGIPDLIRFDDILPGASTSEVLTRLGREKMEFATGNQFSYNQTNYWLLALVIEKITGQSYENFILSNQFADAKTSALFSSNSLEAIPHRVQKYDYDAATNRYVKSTHIGGVRAHSANGLALTLPAFLRWSNRFCENVFLKEETKALMWTPFDFGNKQDVFGYGWELNKANESLSYGFSGGNVSAYRIFPRAGIAIVLLFNGYKNSSSPIQYQVINHLAGLLDKKLADPYLLAEESNSLDASLHSTSKQKIYGYKLTRDKLVFLYKFSKEANAKYIKSMAVVGSFNGWNADAKSYQMTARSKNTFELVLPKSQFEKGKTYEFKFVMNKAGWLTAPHNALNSSGAPDTNLTFKVE